MENQRLQKGEEIAKTPNQVVRVDDKWYKVKSQTSDFQYDVVYNELGWVCSCPDHMYRGVTCKHIYSVEISSKLRQQVKKEVVISEFSLNGCPQCNSSQIVKHGVRHNKYGDVQRYSCLDCKKRFTNNIGFERMRASPQVITSAMQLYFTGESFRNVQKFLKLNGVNVSHMAVYKWINKYVALMEKYLDTIQPNVSNVWRTDELYLKVKGNIKYLFALMDDETRFWISQQVSDNKNTSDVRPLFKKGIDITGKRPITLISDGAHNFHTAYKGEFSSWRKPRTKHIRHITIKGE
jgi:transposase-like protein